MISATRRRLNALCTRLIATLVCSCCCWALIAFVTAHRILPFFCRRGRAENTLCQITIGVGRADALIVRCPQFLFIIVMSVGKWFHLTIQTAPICSLAPGIQSSQKRPGSQPLVDNWVLGHGGKRRAAKISGSIIRFNLLSLKN